MNRADSPDPRLGPRRTQPDCEAWRSDAVPVPDVAPEGPEFPIEEFRRLRFADGLFCPRCGGNRVHRWGRFGWRQRFRCRDCRRTFSDFTGTPLAYLKGVHQWPRFCRSSPDAASIRSCARQFGQAVSTAFRWRRRLLAGLHATDATVLSGSVSVGRTWFPFSQKGSRKLERPPRRVRFEGFSVDTVAEWVVLACDDSGASTSGCVGRNPPRATEVERVLRARVAPSSVVLTREGAYGAPARFASRAGIDWRPERPRPSEGTEPAAVMAWRIRRWLRRFRGVATRYLDEYLTWFRLVDLARGRTRPVRPLDPLLLGVFP